MEKIVRKAEAIALELVEALASAGILDPTHQASIIKEQAKVHEMVGRILSEMVSVKEGKGYTKH